MGDSPDIFVYSIEEDFTYKLVRTIPIAGMSTVHKANDIIWV